MVTAASAPGGERRNPPQFLNSGLSTLRRRCVKLMQDINFGRLERLVIRDGEPVFDPPPEIVREIKFGSEHCPRGNDDGDDFLLKKQVIALFEFFDQLGTGVIESLEVKHGLPFLLSVREAAA